MTTGCRKAILLPLALFLVLTWLLPERARAQKIPALVEVPADLPSETRALLMQRRQALERELADFQAAAKVFNARDAAEQSDAEYARLDAWRRRYINAAKAFNQEVAEARARADTLRKVAPYTVAVGSVRGECTIENREGSRFTNADIKAGFIIRVDTGTRVTTGATGRLQILLPDETVFTIGANSDIIIDEFVYDPDRTPRKIAVSIAKGIFRWVTGKVTPKDPTAMRVITSAVAIGIRGTDFEIFLEAGGSGWVKLHEGMLQITPAKGGDPFLMKERGVLTFMPDGRLSRPKPIE